MYSLMFFHNKTPVYLRRYMVIARIHVRSCQWVDIVTKHHWKFYISICQGSKNIQLWFISDLFYKSRSKSQTQYCRLFVYGQFTKHIDYFKFIFFFASLFCLDDKLNSLSLNCPKKKKYDFEFQRVNSLNRLTLLW